MKKGIFFILFVLVLVISLFVVLVLKNSKPNQVMNSNKMLKQYYLDTDVSLDKDAIDKYLSSFYYEYDTVAGFSCTDFDTNNGLNILSSLQLSEYLPLQKDDLTNLSNLYRKFEDTGFSLFDKATKLNYTAYISHRINSSVDKKQFIDKILGLYDKNERLFFRKNNNDALQTKISATYDLIYALDYLNEINIPTIHNVKSRLIELYSDDKNFDTESYDKLMQNTLYIVNSLHKLGVNAKQLQSFDKRKDWFKTWNKKIIESKDTNILQSIIISTFLETGNFFDSNFQVDKKYLESLDTDMSKLLRLNDDNKVYFADLQSLKVIYTIYTYENGHIDNKEGLVDYIRSQIKGSFRKVDSVAFDMEQTFYAYQFADKINFYYNKNKAKNLIKDFMSESIVNSILIDNAKDMKNVLFIVLNSKYLGLELENKTNLVNQVKSKIQKLCQNNETTESSEENMNYLFFAIQVLEACNEKIDNSQHKMIENYMNKNYNKLSLTFSNVYANALQIYYYLGVNIKNKNVVELINNVLKFSSKDGVFIKKINTNSEDLYQTYHCVSSLNFIDPTWLKSKKSSLNQYINTCKDAIKIYNNATDSPDFQTIFGGYMLSKLCNNPV